MKKLLLSSVAAAVVLSSGIGFGEKAEAATTNYLSASIVKKAKAGTLTIDGFKIGSKAYSYYQNKKYVHDGARIYAKTNGYVASYNDKAFVDLQKGVKLKDLKITRFVDYSVSNDRNIKLEQILNKYGKPALSEVTDDGYGNVKRVDVYKNITFYYQGYEDNLKLDGVVIKHNKTKQDLQKWMDYASGEMEFDVDKNQEYITSSEWADL